MTPKQWISICNIIIYLETKCCPNRRIFVFWQPFWIQNGRHSKPKWSPYGGACLTPCKYPFPLKPPFLNLKQFIFIYFFFILKILKTKSTTLSDDLFLCQVSKGSKYFLNPPFLFPWQLRQSLSNRFRLFWLISFH